MKIEWKYYDVVVIGSGGAGAQAALAASQEGCDVLVVSKDPLSSSDTKISEGLATVRKSGDENDTEEDLSNNLKMAGKDLPSKKLTDAFAKDSIKAYDRYRVNGLRPKINKENSGPQSLPLAMGGHNKNRSVGHESNGVAFAHTNWDTIINRLNIDYLEDSWFLEIVTEDINANGTKKKYVTGGVVYDASRGVLLVVKTFNIVIASGGLSTLYFPKTDTMRGNTGDSYALALRAGAELLDMEQIQFLPFCLTSPPSYEGLLVGEPSSASFLGVLKDNKGKIILDGVYLRTRAECSSAIMRAVEAGRGSPNGGAYLDLTPNKNKPLSGPYFMKYIQSVMPSAYDNAKQALGKEAANIEVAWEVRPSAHYSMGGVRVNENCESIIESFDGNALNSIEGLYAAGQAMGGLFGANRLGSTSLAELSVFGYRAGKAAAQNLEKEKNIKVNNEKFNEILKRVTELLGRKGKYSSYALKLELQKESWEKIGPVRTKGRIDSMLISISKIEEKFKNVSISNYSIWNQSLIEHEELRNMLLVAKSIATAALEREKSLGGHVRLDSKSSSFLNAPYSTVIKFINKKELKIKRIRRDRTKITTLILYKYKEYSKLFRAKLFRHLPSGIQDRRLEKKYKNIMNESENIQEVIAGGEKAAKSNSMGF